MDQRSATSFAGLATVMILAGFVLLTTTQPPNLSRTIDAAELLRIPDSSGPLPRAAPNPPADAPAGLPRAGTLWGDLVALRVGDDLQAVVDQTPPGTHFFLEAGIHREQTIVPRDGDRYTGEPGAVMSGARVLRPQDFRFDGRHWRVAGQTQQGATHGQVAEDFERDARPEELFVDGRALVHTSDLERVADDAWHFDYDADEIVIGFDPHAQPSRGLIETSTVPYAFIGKDTTGVTIENLTVTHYANPAQRGAISGRDSTDWTVRFVEASNNHGIGIGIGNGMTVNRVRVVSNGQMGIGGLGKHTENGRQRPVRVLNSEIASNKRLRFDWEWEGGATKFVATKDMIFQNNWVHNNNGPGPWWDIDNVDAVIRHNLVEENTVRGIFYEISFGALIEGNLIRDNGPVDDPESGAGIYVANSSDVEIVGNVLSGHSLEIIATNSDRGGSSSGLGQWEVRGLDVRDNFVTLDSGEVGLRVFDGSTHLFDTNTNFFDGNVYVLDPSADRFAWDGRSMTFAEWQDRGLDRNSRVVAATASPPTVGFRTTTYGPVSDLSDLPAPPGR